MPLNLLFNNKVGHLYLIDHKETSRVECVAYSSAKKIYNQTFQWNFKKNVTYFINRFGGIHFPNFAHFLI